LTTNSTSPQNNHVHKYLFVFIALLIFAFGIFFRAQAATEFQIVSPTTETVAYGNSIIVKFTLPPNFHLSGNKIHSRSVFGEGHIHLWLDQPVSKSTSAIHVDTDTFTLENVRYGSHVLNAELVNNDDSSLSPPATASVSFISASTPPANASPHVKFLLTLTWTAILGALSYVLVSKFLTVPSPKTSPKPKRTSKAKSRK
jgi:hypothetical protein